MIHQSLGSLWVCLSHSFQPAIKDELGGEMEQCSHPPVHGRTLCVHSQRQHLLTNTEPAMLLLLMLNLKNVQEIEGNERKSLYA